MGQVYPVDTFWIPLPAPTLISILFSGFVVQNFTTYVYCVAVLIIVILTSKLLVN